MKSIYNIYEGILDDDFATNTNVDKRVARNNKIDEFGLKEIQFRGHGWELLCTTPIKAIKRDTSLLHRLIKITDKNTPEDVAKRFAGIIFNLLLNIEKQEIDFYSWLPYDTGNESTGVKFIQQILYKNYKLDASVSLEDKGKDTILEIFSVGKNKKVNPFTGIETISVKFIFDANQFEKHFD